MKQGTIVILKLLNAAVEFYNRPVSYGDLLEFSKNTKSFPAFGIRRIKDDVRRLVIASEIIKAGNNESKSKGRFVYLPANADIYEVEFLQTNSPVQIVEKVFGVLWNERIINANSVGVLPKPILTNDIYQISPH